jgi:hypothetical protein
VTLVRRELAADGKPGRRTLAVDQCHEGESDHDDRVSESRGDIHGGVSGATQLSCPVRRANSASAENCRGESVKP